MDMRELMEKLTELHRKQMSELVEKLDDRFDKLHAEFKESCRRISDLEDKQTKLERDNEKMAARIASLEEAVARHTVTITEQEDRARRNNLRIIGLPEGTESGNLIDFAGDFLQKLFALDETPKVEEAYRVNVAVRAGSSARPRPLIVRLAAWPMKEKIMRKARRARDSTKFNGKPILVFEDFSKRTADARARFSPARKRFFEAGVPTVLGYPAKLKIITADGARWFDCPDNALECANRECAKKHNGRSSPPDANSH